MLVAGHQTFPLHTSHTYNHKIGGVQADLPRPEPLGQAQQDGLLVHQRSAWPTLNQRLALAGVAHASLCAMYTGGGGLIKVEAHGADGIRVRAVPKGGAFRNDLVSALLPLDTGPVCRSVRTWGAEPVVNGNLRAAVLQDGRLRFTRVSDNKLLLEERQVRKLRPPMPTECARLLFATCGHLRTEPAACEGCTAAVGLAANCSDAQGRAACNPPPPSDRNNTYYTLDMAFTARCSERIYGLGQYSFLGLGLIWSTNSPKRSRPLCRTTHAVCALLEAVYHTRINSLRRRSE